MPAQNLDNNNLGNKYNFQNSSELSVSKAAALLKISASSLRRLEQEGKINSYRLSNGYRVYKLGDVKNLKESLEKPKITEEQVKAQIAEIKSESANTHKIKSKSYYELEADKAFVNLITKVRNFTHALNYSLITVFFMVLALITAANGQKLNSAYIGTLNCAKEKALTECLQKYLGLKKSLDGTQKLASQLNINVLGDRSRNPNFEFNLNVPGNLKENVIAEKELQVNGLAKLFGGLDTNNQNGTFGTGNVTVGQIAFTGTRNITNLGAIDNTTETTLEAQIDIAGDVVGTGLNSVVVEKLNGIPLGDNSNDDADGNVLMIQDGEWQSLAQSEITEVGAIGAGTWEGDPIETQFGGTGLETYNTGDMIYASAADTLLTLPIGTSGQVLTVSSGLPAWQTLSLTCTNCVVVDPAATQTITPTSSSAVGLVVAQASGGSVDIFRVTNNGGGTTYFSVNSSGNINLANDVTFSATTPTISVNDGSTLTINDGTNTLVTIADNGPSGTLTVNTIAATNIGGFALTGNVTGSGSPTLSGLGSINSATISGGTLSGGTFSGGTYSNTGLTVSGAYTATIGNGNTFSISDGTNTLLTLTDNGSVGDLSNVGSLTTTGSTDLTTGSNQDLTISPNGTGDLVLGADGDTSLIISGFNCSTYGNGGVLTTDASGIVSCADDDGGVGVDAFTSSSGIIDKTAITDRLRLRYGEAGDTQLEVENVTTNTIPTADAVAINLTGGSAGITTDGVDALFINAEFGNGTANINSGIQIDIDPVNSPSGDESFYGLNIAGLTGTSALEAAINIGSGWDRDLNFVSTSPDISIGDGGTLTINDGSNTLASIIDGGTEGTLTLTGDLNVNGASSADISTTTLTASVFNTNATTLNIGGAATTLNLGAGTGTTQVNNGLTVTGILTANGTANFNTDVNFALGDGENVVLTNTAATVDQVALSSTITDGNNVDILSITVTDNTSTSGIGRGLFIETGNGSATLDAAIAINHTDTGQAMTSGFIITGDSSTAVTTAIDLSDAEIGIALALGSNTVTVGGITLESNELALLDARGGVLVDSINVGTYATTAVTAGSGLTGGGATGALTLNIGTGNGITVNADDIAVDATTSGTTTTASANSGIESTSTGIRLLGGCTNGQVLGWNSSSVIWECSNPGSLSGVGDITAVGDITSGAAFTQTAGADGTTLYFEGATSDSNEIALTSADPGSDIIVVLPAITGTVASLSGTQSFVGAKSFDATTTFNTDVDLTFAGAENLALTNTSASADQVSLTSTIADTNSVDILSITVTDNTVTSGTGRGLFIETGNGSATLDAAIAINHTDTGQAMTSGITITGDTSTAITTAVDLSDAEIGIALALGSNTVTVGGVTLESNELALLDARGGVLVDSINVGTYATTAVTAGSGLTGGGTTGALTLNIGAGNGITVNADDITVDATTSGTTTNVSSNAGIESTSAGIRLLGGCSSDQVLSWNSSGSVWQCTTVAGIGGVGDITAVGDITSGAAFTQTAGADGTTLYFEGSTSDSNEIALTSEDPTGGDITVTLPNIVGTLASLAGTQSFVGAKSFDATSTFNTDVDLAFAGAENLALTNTSASADQVSLTSTIADTNSVDILSITVTDNTVTSGTGRGLFIETGNGSASLDAAIAINHTDTGQAMTSGITITGDTSTAITTAVDLSDAEIGIALALGANTVTVGGVTLESNELALLDARGGVLVDSINVGTYATTAVTAGSGLTGGGTTGALTLYIGAGNGITVNTDDIAVDATTSGTTTTVISNSGIESTSAGVRLLGGCSDTQVLSWSSGTSLWQCTDVGGIGGVGDITAVGDITNGPAFTQTAGADGTTLYFEGATSDSNEIALTSADPGSDIIVVLPAITGTVASLSGTQSFVGAKSFDATTTFNTDVDLAFAGAENLALTNTSASADQVSLTSTIADTNSVDVLSITVTDNTVTSGTGRGLFIETGNGSATLDAAIAINHTDTGQAMTSGIIITGDSSTAVTTAIDLSDAEIGIALALGSNTVTVGGVTLESNELVLLDARGGVLVDSINVGTYATTAVTAGSGLTGGGATGALTLNIGTGNGITVNADDITVDATTSGTTTTASANSGIESTSTGIRLLGGCSNDEVLAWNSASSIWACAAVTGLGGTGDIIAVGDITSGAAFTQTAGADGTTLYFEGSTSDSNEIALTSADPGSDIIVVLPAITGTVASLSGTQSFVGAKSFEAITTFNTDVDLAFAGAENLSLTNTSASTDQVSLTSTIADTNSVDILSITVTDNTATSGIGRGLFIETGNGSASLDAAIAINHTDTGQAMTSGLIITGDTSTAITTAVDLSDAEIGIALALGSNTVTVGGVTLESNELVLLDARGGVLVDSINVGTYATTAVTAGSGLTGGGTTGALTLNIGAGNGITVNADDITVDATTSGTTTTASANSGIESTSTGVRLIGGCSDGQVLSWIASSSTWDCTAVSGIGGVGDITAVGSITSGAAFADSTADDDWLGLGALAGRIEFDDQAIDEINLLSAYVGVGTNAPNNPLEVLSTTATQVRVAYDTSNYFTQAVSSAGAVTFDATGGSAGFSFSDNVIFNADVDLAFAGAENLALTNTSASADQVSLTSTIADTNSVDILSITVTDNTVTSGTGRGLFIETGNGSASLDAAIAINHTDTGQAMTSGITITGDTSTAITTAVDLSDAEIGIALALGANTVTVGGVTLESNELALLDARGGVLVDSINVGTYATTAVTAGSGLTGGGTTGALTLYIGAGNGITVNADDIAVDATTSGTTTTTSANSGIESTSAGIRLLGGCSSSQILAWNSSSALWECTTASSLADVGDITAVGDVTSGSAFTQTAGADGTTLYFEGATSDSNEIALTSADPGSDIIVVLPAITGTVASLSGTQSFVGAKSFDATTTFNTDVDLTFAGAENLALTNTSASADQVSLTSTIADTNSVDVLSITVTDNTVTSGTGRGLFIETGNGSATLDAAIAINHTDTGQAMTSGLSIAGDASTTITTALDVSDDQISTALAIGSNDITVTGATISSTELALLDGRSGTLVDSNNVATYATTGVTAGGGLTGGGTVGVLTVDIGAGNGITVNANDIAVDATTSATTTTTSSNSGIESTSTGIRLLGGCGSGQVLSWNSGSSLWECASVGSLGPFTAAGGIIDKTTVNDRLRLMYGEAADTQLTIENTTNAVVPTADVMQINLSGGSGVTTDGVDALYVNIEGANGTANTVSALRLDFDPISASGDETFYGLNVDGITGGSAAETAINIGTGWDTDINLADTSPIISIGGGGTLVINDGTNTLMSIADNGTNGILTVNTIAATNIGAFTLTGNITGSGSPTLSGLGTINSATISGGTLSGGSLSGGTYSNTGVTVTGGYTVTIANANTFNINDGSANIFTIGDGGSTGTISLGGATISSAELDLLDGRAGTLVDSINVGTYATTAVTAGSGLTGGGGVGPLTLNIGAGNGITVNADDIAVDATTSGTTTSTSTNSGIEATSTGVRLLGGCSDDEVLAWNSASSIWACAAVTGLGSTGDIIAVGDITSGAAFTQTAGADGTTLYFEGATSDSNEIALTSADPGSDIIVVLPAITGTVASLSGTQSFVGAKSFDATTTFNTDVDLTFAGAENLALTNTSSSADQVSLTSTIADTNSVDVLSITVTDNTVTSGTGRGLFIETGNGSATLDAAIAINHTDTGQAMTSGITITGAASTAITTAIDVSDAEIGIALALGSNTVTVGGVTLESNELALLDARGGVLVDSINVGTYATTAVTAGSGLTGGGTTGALTLNIGAGNGITVNADDIAVDATTAGTTTTTSANSGIESTSTGIRLLGGCTNGQVLGWNSSSSVWECSTATSLPGVGDITAVGSMTSGVAFGDSTADDDWLGLGALAGRIEFDDQAIDEVNILSAYVGIGTNTPNNPLEVLSTTATQLRVAYDTSNYFTQGVSSAGVVTFNALGASAGFTFADDLVVSATTPNIAITNGETLTFTDGSNTLMTLADNGTSGTLALPALGYLNLSAITHATNAISGILLPQGALASGPSSGNGYLAFDTDDSQVKVWTGGAWSSISGASTTLQQAYVAGATIDITSGEGALDIDAQSANVDFEIGQGTDTGDFRIWDTSANWLLIDESADTMDIGAAAGGGLTLDAGAGTVYVGTSANAKTVNIGSSTGATQLNFTSGTGSQTHVSSVTTGSTTSAAFVFTENSLTSGDGLYMSSSSITQGDLMQLSTTDNTLTSGSLLNISSALTNTTFTGNLTSIDWSPSGTSQIYNTSADLLHINLGQYGNINNLLNITDNGSALFQVGESAITSAIPHAFTAAGDISIAYDVNLTNQTASYITSNGPFYIRAGESFENNNLSLQTYGTGNLVFEPQGTGYFYVYNPSTSVDGATTTNLNVAGEFITTSDTDTISLLVRNTATGAIFNNVGTAGPQGDPGTFTVEGATSGTAYNLITAYNSNTRSDAAAVFRVRADGTVYGEAAFQTSGADYAEYFEKEENIEAGDMIGLNKTTGKVRKFSAGDQMMGVFSTKPGFVGNNISGMTDGERDLKYALVGLIGQIELKVTSENGNIKSGDAVTYSPRYPGVGTKALSSGPMIGRALQNYENTDTTQIGEILVFIRPSWYTPEALALQLDDFGNLVTQFENIDTVIGQNVQQAAAEIASGVNDSIDTKVSSTNNALSELTSRVEVLEASQSQTETIESIKNNLALINDLLGVSETTESSQSSGSSQYTGLLDKIKDAFTELKEFMSSLGISTVNGDLVISNNTNILGDLTLNGLTTTGNANFGLLQIDSLANAINMNGPACFNEATNTLNAELCEAQTIYLQKNLAGNINIFDGKVVIEPDGTLTVKGTIDAETVTAKEFVVKGTSSNIGSGTIDAGQTTITIETPSIKTNSKVFVTATSSTGGQTLIVGNKIENTSFDVYIDDPATSNITFDWWIVSLN